ncbi:hypothetical protein Cci01nite_15910 [Catellatospora citrea]|uniref:Uncharacterized protein n=1 Tax=Catellatospora citrea TaxID=53366 RepID=A0A8J3K4W1_9ACTN|nr:hypothetical protein Cci01nite_15910 [Catellatospora citrea]
MRGVEARRRVAEQETDQAGDGEGGDADERTAAQDPKHDQHTLPVSDQRRVIIADRPRCGKGPVVLGRLTAPAGPMPR